MVSVLAVSADLLEWGSLAQLSSETCVLNQHHNLLTLSFDDGTQLRYIHKRKFSPIDDGLLSR